MCPQRHLSDSVNRHPANPLVLLFVIELLFDLLSAVADFFHRVLDLGL